MRKGKLIQEREWKGRYERKEKAGKGGWKRKEEMKEKGICRREEWMANDKGEVIRGVEKRGKGR